MIKLISLNVEGSKHWDRIDPFLDDQNADVICLQEVFEEDLLHIEQRLRMLSFFAPMTLRHYDFSDERSPYKKMGIAILSRLPILATKTQYYHASAQELQHLDNSNEHTQDASIWRALLSVNIDRDGETFTIATTHFTWTPDGLSRDYQYTAAHALLALLGEMPDVALCGDFNMPRGINDVYELFSKKYRDAIPASYTSSLDLTFHRAKDDPQAAEEIAKYMVDYLFLSKGYAAENVQLHSGVSDHCAIIASLSPDDRRVVIPANARMQKEG
jgi:endonuclease/exonuclease/phosphatase family metal-dependent hydrolase